MRKIRSLGGAELRQISIDVCSTRRIFDLELHLGNSGATQLLLQEGCRTLHIFDKIRFVPNQASGASGHDGFAIFETFVGACLTADHTIQVRANLTFASQNLAIWVNDCVAGLAGFENSFPLGRIACGESGGCSGGQDRKNGRVNFIEVSLEV